MALEHVENLSKALFGSSDRLSILRAIATSPDEELYPAQIAQRADVRPNQVGTDIRRLEEVGLVRPRRVEGSNRQYVTRVPSVLWKMSEELYAEALKRKSK